MSYNDLQFRKKKIENILVICEDLLLFTLLFVVVRKEIVT